MTCQNTAIIYSKPLCPNCVSAKQLLTSKNYCIEEKIIGENTTIEELFKHIGHSVRSVPQIFINDAYVGDYTALIKSLE